MVDWILSHAAVALVIVVACGFLEIGGSYLVWMQIKDQRPWWLLIFGCVALSAYGFVATLQTLDFGRVYAVYGGLFIVISGAALCCAGAAAIYFAPNAVASSAATVAGGERMPLLRGAIVH